MARQSIPFLAFNRGLLSPKALARVDIDRTRLSAERYTNLIGATQGSMAIRPGTKYFGSSLRDSGAEFLEFVSSVDDVALVELTDGTMRLWIGDDAHELELLSRPAVDTTVSLDDTGWSNASTGGSIAASSSSNLIPMMTGPTTSGVTITASSQNTSAGDGGDAWHAGDQSLGTAWRDTGNGTTTVPSWLNIDFGSDTGDRAAVSSYSIRSSNNSSYNDNAPSAWRLITGNFDTGTFATDTGKWTLQDERSGETGWALSEKRTYETDEGDTGTVTPRRHWRLYITANQQGFETVVAEIEMFANSTAASRQVNFDNGAVFLNAASIGAIAKAKKRVIVSDTGTEHSLAIRIDQGPVTLRVGSTDGDDDYIGETALGTGYHNLAFTPQGNFHITLQNDDPVNRSVGSLEIGDSGTVEVATPWGAENLDDIRYDQSADVVYVDCPGVQTYKIERRGTGRSWSAVEYAPLNGPFLTGQTSTAKLKVSHFYGNTTMDSNIPFFSPSHVGALFKLNHSGQSGEWPLGAIDAATDAVKITGINDTGTKTAENERRVVFTVAGTWTGGITIERSFDGPEFGFKKVTDKVGVTGNLTDTGTFTTTIDDPEDNLQVWYRAKVTAYTSGVAVVRATYLGGQTVGIAKVTDYIDNQNVDIEVIRRFSDTGYAESWQEGYWSDLRGYPTAVALHGGRLGHANGANLFLSVSDDFENFDQDTDGDAGPIIRTLGSGPVDSIHYLVSLLRMIIGTAGAEISVRSSSLDEPLTPDNCSASAFSTQGSANVRAVKMDTRAIMVQRSEQRVFMIGPAENSLADYEAFDLTLLVPDLLAAGVVSVAIQRQPDTRIHCVLADGTVAILTYEPQEEVVCWTKWETDGDVEKAMVLPGIGEDAVYYHIRRQVGMSNDSYTKVLLHFNGEDGSTTFTDDNAGGSSHVWTAGGNTHIDTAQSKFGGSAALFDGTGDTLTTPDHADFELGSSDFTIDAQFYVTVTGGTDRAIVAKATDGFAAGWIIRRQADDTIAVYMRESPAGASVFLQGTTTFSDVLNPGWHHVEFSRSGSIFRLFIDGVLEDSETASFTVSDNAAVLSIGSWGTTGGQDAWQGWIDEVRLSVGIARHTAAFTPPTRAYGPDNVRYLEKWAMESECEGDTGLHWLADCAVSFSDTGRSTSFSAAALHLAGKQVIAWGDLDTGSTPYVDLSPGVGSAQTTYTVDTGTGAVAFPALTSGVHQGVIGLPYSGTWISSKLAYAAEGGTALIQQKRFAQVGLIAYNIHARGLETGNDTGTLQGLPSKIFKGGSVDPDHIFRTFDQLAFPANGQYSTDERLVLRVTAPRPCTLLAAVVSVQTNDRV